MDEIYSNLVKDVEAKKLVLPDFQRKFIWDKEMMCKLYASVLCRMPLGSILVLNSSDSEFACKSIGAKKRTTEFNASLPKSGLTSYLIDGQQRLTSLFAGFTTQFLNAFKDSPKDAASPDLLDLYFLKIPAKAEDAELDIFNASSLMFDDKYESDSYFPSTIMQKIIYSEKVSTVLKETKNIYFDITNNEHMRKLKDFCTAGINDFYYIPLQFICNRDQKSKNLMRDIYSSIALKFTPEKYENISDDELENIRSNWHDAVEEYLKDSIKKIDINSITVENSDKARAIDIYSNLNLGGVALSVFDLVMAKVGGVTSDNFYDKLIEYVEKNKKYPTNIMKDSVKLATKRTSYNNALEVAKVINKNGELSKDFINVFLNVLVMYLTQKNHETNKPFDVNCTKQENILELDPNDIKDNAEKICTAIDRALFFFQTRCGIRQISDINYKAQIVVIAYFFTYEKLFNDEVVHYLFEYWYWISIFGYLYPSNQNIKIYEEVEKFENFFKDRENNREIINYLNKNRTSVLNADRYSDFNTLTFNKEAKSTPPAIMSKYICQYYLALGYADFFDSNINMDFLYEDGLDIHHIMPLGSDPDFKIQKLTMGAVTKTFRNKPNNAYNSPLNMVYITKKTNKKISDMDYSSYSKVLTKILPAVDCLTSVDEKTTIFEFLEERYNRFYNRLKSRLDMLIGCIES